MDLSAYAVTGTNDAAKQVSVTRWNSLLGAIEEGGHLFTALAGSAISAAVSVVGTTGYRTVGIGSAKYIYDVAVDAAFVTANPLWSFRAADGRGFHLSTDQRVNFFMFGAYGDYNVITPGTLGVNYHDDYSTLLAVLAWSAHIDVATSGDVRYVTPPPVHFPTAGYYVSEAVDLLNGVHHWIGEGMGQGQGGSMFYFAAGKDGFRIHWINTTGKVATRSGASTLGSFTTFERIHAWSLGNAVTDTGSGVAFEQDGHTLRGHGQYLFCTAYNFSRHGFNINADSGAAILGNANSFLLFYCSASRNNKAGFRIGVSDANAGHAIKCQAYYNGYAGYMDESGLGNHFDACESGDNGAIDTGPLWRQAANNVGSFCRYDPGSGLRIWQCLNPATASTTAPGSNDAVWKNLVAGYVNAIYPPWVSGTQTFIDGACYVCDNANACSSFIGCYTEGTDPSPRITNSSIVIGGLLSAAMESKAGLQVRNGYISSGAGFQQSTNTRSRTDGSKKIVRLGSFDPASLVAFFTADGQASDTSAPADPAKGIQAAWDVTTKNLQWQETNSGGIMCQMTGAHTTHQFGRGAAQNAYLLTNRFMVGNGAEARELGSATAMPAAGTYAQGDFIRNTSGTVSAGKILLGWYRLTNGSAHVLNTDWSGCYVTTS